MVGLDLSQNLLSANADFKAEDWATFGASAALDFRAAAELRRGINLQLGAAALVKLDASLSKFLVADVQGQAHAAARVAAQVQVPLDLFSECGVAIRLQAIAEAAAGITLGLGLSIGDFLALAEQDPRMIGTPARLLRIFLEELTVTGSFTAKAAASAMAYANVAVTGQLVPGPGPNPGFTVAAEAGVGLEAGAGFRVSANFGVDDPRRLLRRSIDITVDETLTRVSAMLVGAHERAVLAQLRAPAKMVLRTAFELGLELANNPAAFDPGGGARLAQRCVQVFLEESQRAILDQFSTLGLRELRIALGRIGADQNTWDASAPQRRSLADRLDSLPADPFDPTPENQTYWVALIGEAAALAIALGAQGDPAAEWVEPLAVAWSAVQLLFISVERISTADARASVIGLPPAQAVAPFTGNISQPSAVLREFINIKVGRQPQEQLRQQDLVAFLLRPEAVNRLLSAFPEAETVLELVAGPGGTGVVAALATVLNNLGAFDLDGGGTPDPVASLRIIVEGMQAYVDTRVTMELEPMLAAVLANDNPSLQTYIDEVMLSTLRFTVETTFARVLDWSSGSVEAQTALREACSSVLMRVLGRSLVVTVDVLLQQALDAVQDGLRDAAGHVTDPGGLAPTLAGITGADPELLAEIVAETLEIAADAFGPLPTTKRARIRELLYDIMDTMPSPADSSFLGQLESAGFLPGGQAAPDLALELGGYLGDTIVRFVGAFLDRVGRALVALLQDVLEDLQESVLQFLDTLHDLVRGLVEAVEELFDFVKQLENELEDAADAVLERASLLLDVFAGSAGRSSVRREVRTLLEDEALGVLADNAIYACLPVEGRRIVRDALHGAVGFVLNSDFVEPILSAVAVLAGETADFLDDVRAIGPEDDLAAEIIDLLVDRVEDAVRAAFGYDNPGIDLRIEVLGNTFDLGRIDVPLHDVVAAARRIARDLAQAGNVVQSLAQDLVIAVQAELNLRAAEVEYDIVVAQRDRSVKVKGESQRSQYDAIIVTPASASVHEDSMVAEIRLIGVPRSWLGLELDETPRVFVWVNERKVEIPTFDIVDESSPVIAVPAAGGGSGIEGVVIVDPRPGLRQLAPNTAGQLQPSISARAPLRNSALRAHPVAAARARRHDLASRRNPTITGLGATDGSQTADAARGLLVQPGSATGRRESQAKDRGLTLGRELRPSHMKVIESIVEPGIVLRRKLSLDQLVAGANTIMVSVLGSRADERLVRAATFIVLPSAAPTDGLHLPSEFTLDLQALPDVLRNAARAVGAESRPQPVDVPVLQRSDGYWQPSRASQRSRVLVARDASLEVAAQRLAGINAVRDSIAELFSRSDVSTRDSPIARTHEEDTEYQ